jgi:adenylate kinase
LKLLLVAAPGGGKGTQGDRLAARYHIEHISSGDLLRAEVESGTPLGQKIAGYQRRGDLVPDQIVFDLLMPRVAAAAALGGYLLDGFPRTVPQAEQAFDVARRLDFALDAAIYLKVPDEVLAERMRGRGRPDDTPEVIRHRLEVFAQTTSPLIDYYRNRGVLLEIDGNQPPDAITAQIEAQLPLPG